MNKSYLSTLCIIAMFCICCSRNNSSVLKSQTPLSLQWEQVSNDIPQGFCTAQITITNNTEDTLKNNWKIYYNHLSVKPINNDTSQLKVEQIKASYHSLCPTDLFQPLQPHESKTYTLTYKGSMMRINSAPQGPFVVFNDNASPISIPISINCENTENYKRNIATWKYANGEYIYSENQRFENNDATPYALPILPQPKQFTIKNGTCNLSTANLLYSQDNNIEQEGYFINLQDNDVYIKYSDKNGKFYAQQTLNRLRENSDYASNGLIYDYPDFHHRGFMLDIARNFTKKQDIIRLINYLSAYKINVLHLHLTDDEGWRIEIPGLPELTDVGSKRGYTTDERECLYPMYSGGWDKNDSTASANGYLNRNDFIQILKVANENCMTIIPEIDMPGHSRAAIKAMEARYYKYIQTDSVKATEYLLTDFNDNSVYLSAQYYNDNVLAVNLPSTLKFIEKIIDEIEKMYIDADVPFTMFHIGGDEVAKGAWNKMPREKTEDEFIEKVINILEKKNIQTVGWEEIALRKKQPKPQFKNHNLLCYCWNSVPEWNGDESAHILANAGYKVILSCVTNLYMDLCYVNHEEERGLHWGGYTDEYISFDLQPFNLYESVRNKMNGEKRNIKEYAANNNKIKLNAEAKQNIVGIQAHLFAETIRDFTQVQQYIFPKIFGMVERSWNSTADFSDYMNILNAYNYQIEQYELPRLNMWNVRFHLSQPGIHIENDTVYMNCAVKNAIIRYTTDGSVPNQHSTEYTGAFYLNNHTIIRAKSFFLGEESNTTTQIKEPKPPTSFSPQK